MVKSIPDVVQPINAFTKQSLAVGFDDTYSLSSKVTAMFRVDVYWQRKYCTDKIFDQRYGSKPN